jgi:DNA-directed RNA polymerase beta' subunit
MNFHVPVSDAAVKEVKEKMMPSTNLLSIKQNKAHYQPSQEFILGMYKASTPNPKKKTVVFSSNEEAEAAYKSGMIDIDTPIMISSSAAGLLSAAPAVQSKI